MVSMELKYEIPNKNSAMSIRRVPRGNHTEDYLYLPMYKSACVRVCGRVPEAASR